MHKILVTGSNGLLGQKIIYRLLAKGHTAIIATGRGNNRLKIKDGYQYISLDLTDTKAVEDVIRRHNPDCIIHTAAMTNVDACELDPEECKKQNIDAVKSLIENSKPFRTHFILLSTDFVFDGTSGPYSEEDAPNPLSVYARSKVEAENLVKESGLPWTIIRTMIIYGVADDLQRSNVVLWTKNSLEQKKKINVITDQFRGPTLAEDLAEACINASEKKAEGIYHVSGAEIIPIIEISKTVAGYFGLDATLINPVTTAELKQPAQRPLKTGFNITKAIRELDFKPRSLRQGLAVIEKQLSGN